MQNRACSARGKSAECGAGRHSESETSFALVYESAENMYFSESFFTRESESVLRFYIACYDHHRIAHLFLNTVDVMESIGSRW